jgi:hypothetical protein
MGIPGPVSSVTAVPVALNVARARGYLLFVVTNQPDVVQAISRRGPVHAIHGPPIAASIIGVGRR